MPSEEADERAEIYGVGLFAAGCGRVAGPRAVAGRLRFLRHSWCGRAQRARGPQACADPAFLRPRVPALERIRTEYQGRARAAIAVAPRYPGARAAHGAFQQSRAGSALRRVSAF